MFDAAGSSPHQCAFQKAGHADFHEVRLKSRHPRLAGCTGARSVRIHAHVGQLQGVSRSVGVRPLNA
jgi:hypothetical protein